MTIIPRTIHPRSSASSRGEAASQRTHPKGARQLPALCLCAAAVATLTATGPAAQAADELRYHLSFPSAGQRVMDVALDIPASNAAVELVMSRSSPGRYALHEFAKNVFDVQAADAGGRPVPLARVAPHRWSAPARVGSLRVRYRVYGDRVDGTYLAIDATHAHVNVPAALLWVRGFEHRASTVVIEPPPGADWRVATQLFATSDPLTFTAPNLAYLVDSPIEASRHARESFRAPALPGSTEGPAVSLALHAERADAADAAAYVDPLRRLAVEAAAVFGEYPAFDGGRYTFIVDVLPWAAADGMEHRNSTVITLAASPEYARRVLLGTAAHEFLHAWNVERIRPRSLEPFDLEAANVSAELWLAEGVTTYYEKLLTCRAGQATHAQTLQDWSDVINQVIASPATRVRSAEEMSRMAVFTDGPAPLDRTNWQYSYVSHYVHGAALGLALDLALRALTAGTRSLDDFMRAMWVHHGLPEGHSAGSVASPYTIGDVRARLAEVSGDPTFARTFLERYVQGREVPDYQALLAPAGLRLRRVAPGRATLGLVPLERRASSLRIVGPIAPGTPLADAGLGEDDEIVGVEGSPTAAPEVVERALLARKPGDLLSLQVMRRGEPGARAVRVRLSGDPRIAIVPAESMGEPLPPAERAFREAWLRSRVAGVPSARLTIGPRRDATR